MEYHGFYCCSHWVTEFQEFYRLYYCFSVLTMLPFGSSPQQATQQADTVDLRTLRAVRVLRPLKLVSGIPSELSFVITRSRNRFFFQVCKSSWNPSCVQWLHCSKSDCLCCSPSSSLPSLDWNSTREHFTARVTTSEVKLRTFRKNRCPVPTKRHRWASTTVMSKELLVCKNG